VDRALARVFVLAAVAAVIGLASACGGTVSHGGAGGGSGGAVASGGGGGAAGTGGVAQPDGGGGAPGTGGAPAGTGGAGLGGAGATTGTGGLGGAAGSNDAATDASDGGGDGAADTPPCTSGLVVSAAGGLDLDLATLSLSGVVTLAGAAAPAGDPRGTVSFLLAGTKKAVDVALPATGAATYATRLFAGTYAITYTKASGDCGGAGKLPCGAQTIFSSIALAASGSLDLDLAVGPPPPAAITVSGEVTVNGAAMANGAGAQSRGRILFVPPGGGTPVAAALGASGRAVYTSSLAPGKYDVVIDGASPCSPLGPLPCQTSTRLAGQSLTTSGSLNVDLPIVMISGTVTVDGAAVPAGAGGQSRGSITVSDAEGRGPTLDLGAGGAAIYTTPIYKGVHAFTVSNAAACATGPLPCQRLRALSGIDVETTGSVDVDLHVVKVSGTITVNGADMPSSARGASRGLVAFGSGDARVSADLDASGAAVYRQLPLYAGTYDVGVENAADCPDGALPCGAHTALAAVALTASGSLDVDLAVARVTGAVTVNGGAMPASPAGHARGTLTFAGPTSVAASIAPAGAAAYAVTVYPGAQALSFANTNDCPAGPAPCQTYALPAPVTVVGDASLNVDLPVAEVSGTVTTSGQPVGASASGGSRGLLRFEHPTAGPVSADLGTTGAATYRVRVYPGSYRVLFSNATDCPTNDEGALPCQGDAVIAQAVPLLGIGSRDFDLPVVSLSGTLTENAMPLPASPTGAARGALSFGVEPAGAARTVSLSAAGPATYQVRLVAGTYDVGLKNDLDCPNGALPCQQRVLFGCRVP
jgi:hypothetical protein